LIGEEKKKKKKKEGVISLERKKSQWVQFKWTAAIRREVKPKKGWEKGAANEQLTRKYDARKKQIKRNNSKAKSLTRHRRLKIRFKSTQAQHPKHRSVKDQNETCKGGQTDPDIRKENGLTWQRGSKDLPGEEKKRKNKKKAPQAGRAPPPQGGKYQEAIRRSTAATCGSKNLRGGLKNQNWAEGGDRTSFCQIKTRKRRKADANLPL